MVAIVTNYGHVNITGVRWVGNSGVSTSLQLQTGRNDTKLTLGLLSTHNSHGFRARV